MAERAEYVGWDDIVDTSLEAGASKLGRLVAADLVPPTFVDLPGVVAPVSIVAAASDRSVSYIISDAMSMNLTEMAHTFEILTEEDLEDFPRLRRGSERFARPLAYGDMSEIGSDLLLNEAFEINPFLRGRGAGVALHESLVRVAGNLGFKFLTGHQDNAGSLRFFLNRGRYSLTDIRDDRLHEFDCVKAPLFRAPDLDFFTIKFLQPDDIAQYVKPDKIREPVALRED
ncbi:MAG TPA: hypothetical protein VK694_03050 [Verrucomicrobiae bacterium]|nr:hypothetical protein [Verrucomicrobiae bacterium]